MANRFVTGSNTVCYRPSHTSQAQVAPLPAMRKSLIRSAAPVGGLVAVVEAAGHLRQHILFTDNRLSGSR